MAKRKVRCDDCYFRKNMLCALKLTEPCTTFRHAERGLVPPPQLSFHFRPDRTRLVRAFPPPDAQLAVAD